MNNNNVRDRFFEETRKTNLPAYELWKIFFFLTFCAKVNSIKTTLFNMLATDSKYSKGDK